MSSPWRSLEIIPGLSASAAVWRRYWADDFDIFRAAFLQKKAVPGNSFPCPRNCGCMRFIVHPPVSPVLSVVCHCEPPHCDPVTLSPDEITPLCLNWPKLARALARALGLNPAYNDFPLPNTRQLGSRSCEAVPVILTIQTERQIFRRVVSELALRLKRPFILFGPTGNHLDAPCQELLGMAQAGFFSLETHVRLNYDGTLQTDRVPGALFTRFIPQPDESSSEDSTRKALALVKGLDATTRMKFPSPVAIFSFYCVHGLSIARIARRCRCSRGTILNRLAFIRKRTGIDPDRIRASAPGLRMEGEM
jgi:hypothetical protein